MKRRIYNVIAFLLLCGTLRAADVPKVAEFTPQQKAAIAAMNAKLEMLAQEERAVVAEKQGIQLQFKALLDDACRAAGGEGCQPDIAKGTFTVPTKPAK